MVLVDVDVDGVERVVVRCQHVGVVRLEALDHTGVRGRDLVLDAEHTPELDLVPGPVEGQVVQEARAGDGVDVRRRLGDDLVGSTQGPRELEQPVQVAVPALGLGAEHLLGHVLDDCIGHLVRHAGDPAGQHAARVVGHAPVVLARPPDQVLLGRLTLHHPLDPVRSVQRPTGCHQLLAHVLHEHLTVEAHRPPFVILCSVLAVPGRGPGGRHPRLRRVPDARSAYDYLEHRPSPSPSVGA